MAKIKIEGILKQLDYEFKSAFIKTIKVNFPGMEFDEKAVYKKFTENLTNECKKWEVVPDDTIEKGDY